MIDSEGEEALDTLQITITEPNNEPPEVEILSPVLGESLQVGQPVMFSALALDDIDGDLSTQIQ